MKRRKRKSKSEDKISDGKKPRPVELSNNKNDSNQTSENRNNNNNNKNSSGKSNNTESTKNGTDIIGCRTVSNNAIKKSPPCLKKQDESGQKTKPVHEKKVGFKLDPLPKIESSEEDTKSKVKLKVKTDSSEKDESKPISPKSRSPPILKPEVITKIISKKETNNKMNNILDAEESSDEDDDKPPSEKKLKIDESVGNNVENQPTNNIKIKEQPNNIKIKDQSNNIKIKVSADDVKKVEPIKKVEPKSLTQQPELTKIQKKEVVTTNHQPKKESPEIKEEKPSKTMQDTKPIGNIIKPKLLPSPNSNKQKSTNTNLSNIVNNLAKKQLLNNATPKSTTAGNQTPPSSILGGQTTITKKEVKNDEIVNKNNVSNHVNEKNVKIPAADLSKSTTTPKGIPKDTSVTVRSVSSSSSTTPLSNSTTKVSFSNPSFKKNGTTTNSMMDLIQKASNNQTSMNTPNSHTSNGLVSPNKKSSTLSDLRQFRKESANKPQGGGSNTNTHQRAPIIPSLTSRNLTFGNSKSVANSKTNSNSTSSNSSSTTSKSSPTSSFSAVLSKPLPKPGEASSAATANNFLNQANQLSALAALGLGANFSAFTDEQQRALLRNMAAVGFQFPQTMTGLQPNVPTASVTQQLPSNRLKLTVSQAKNNSSSGHSGSPGSGSSSSGNPLHGMIPPSLASHMSPENQWKMFSPLAAAAAASGNTGGTNGLSNHTSKYSSLSKNLNQSIRQIPNPSLLTKQASEQQQQLLQRAIASQVSAAAAVAAANARTSLS